MIVETKRLELRELTATDMSDLCEILCDKEVMYAYEHAFSREEAEAWLKNQLQRYQTYGFGLWAVILKRSGEMIGQCGLSMQHCEGEEVLEIGYLFKKAFWHQGYASEAAQACKRYAFDVLQEPRVYSIIRDTNLASQRVALRNGMRKEKQFIKHYFDMEMPHDVFVVERNKEKE